MSTKKYYDEFARKSLKDMASAISDMTYAYENTMVPKEHYSKVLSAELEDLMATDVNIELSLLEPYLKILTDLKKENPKYFFKALVMLEMGIKINSIQAVTIDALNFSWNTYDCKKAKDKLLLNQEIIDIFKDVQENGLNSTNDGDPA